MQPGHPSPDNLNFRFLLDNNIDYRTKAALRQVGFEALQLSDVGLQTTVKETRGYKGKHADTHGVNRVGGRTPLWRQSRHSVECPGCENTGS